MRRLALVASLFLVAVGACSSGSDADSSPPTTVATGLRGKLLVANDLPGAFVRTSVEELDPNVTNSEYCAELDTHQRDFPGQRVAEAQFRRVKGNATIFVNEIIRQYVDEAEATRAFEDFQKALDNCASVTRRDGANATVSSFEPVEFVKIGDDSQATTFNATQTVDEDSASVSGNFVAFRARRYVVLLAALGSVDSLPKKDVEAIAKRAVAHI